MEVIEKIFLFAFGCIGVTHILVDGEIFRPVKEYMDQKVPKFLMKLLNCYQCTGFWVGVFFGFFMFCNCEKIHELVLNLFLTGGASSCLSYLWALILTYLEANSVIKIDNNAEQQQ